MVSPEIDTDAIGRQVILACAFFGACYSFVEAVARRVGISGEARDKLLASEWAARFVSCVHGGISGLFAAWLLWDDRESWTSDERMGACHSGLRFLP